MSKTKKPNKKNTLQLIEENTFNMGTFAYNVFKKTTNYNALRASVSAYRASMQAMRDQMRYNISK